MDATRSFSTVLIQQTLGVVRTTRLLALRFDRDHCFRIAAALSYTTLLSLVPLITVLFSAIALFPIGAEWSVVIEDFLFEHFVPAAGDTVRDYLHTFSDQAGKLTTVGLIFLLVSAISLLSTIEDAFNGIWEVKTGRRWIQRVLIYWALLTMGPILIAASLSMSSTLLSYTLFTEQGLGAGIRETLLRYLPVILELLAFLLFYQAVPNREVTFRASFWGAVLATALFEVLKFGFAYWILNFNSYQVIYGAIATIPIFFVWVFLCWMVLLIGAQLAAYLGGRGFDRETSLLPSSD